MNYSPIALFVYKRPEHTRQTLEALIKCPEFEQSKLYVFCDAAKRSEDEKLVDKTRAVVRALVDNKATIIEESNNKGLVNSIISGVTKLVNEFGKVIVLEDDLIVSPGFLQYMNQALEIYQNENRVMQISGYMFPISEFIDKTETMFLPFTVSWGWATWQRAWKYFDCEAMGWQKLKTDHAMRYRFNLNGAYDYFSMLKNQFNGKCDSWAILWYWSVFKQSGLVLFPPISYVENNGLDGSGTHGSLSYSYKKLESSILKNKKSLRFPRNDIQVLPKNFEIVQNTLKKSVSFLGVIKNTLNLNIFL